MQVSRFVILPVVSYHMLVIEYQNRKEKNSSDQPNEIPIHRIQDLIFIHVYGILLYEYQEFLFLWLPLFTRVQWFSTKYPCLATNIPSCLRYSSLGVPTNSIFYGYLYSPVYRCFLRNIRAQQLIFHHVCEILL